MALAAISMERRQPSRASNIEVSIVRKLACDKPLSRLASAALSGDTRRSATKSL